MTKKVYFNEIRINQRKKKQKRTKYLKIKLVYKKKWLNLKD